MLILTMREGKAEVIDQETRSTWASITTEQVNRHLDATGRWLEVPVNLPASDGFWTRLRKGLAKGLRF